MSGKILWKSWLKKLSGNWCGKTGWKIVQTNWLGSCVEKSCGKSCAKLVWEK